ncbi:unnamed protein product [Mytilus coruscus]|uniref:Uncharacterized protein n=1 Tax=Mytilus coruscus TaxID=42192 RepID=A0A6J8C8D4_MYTCO|nr:unnamed protein product [Mytilus coruscus]
MEDKIRTNNSDSHEKALRNTKERRIKSMVLTILNSVYNDYPKQCFPDKLTKLTGHKAKELKYEVVDDTYYEAEANMVAFRVPVNKLAPYTLYKKVIKHNSIVESTQTETDEHGEGSGDDHFADETTAKTPVDTSSNKSNTQDVNNNTNQKPVLDNCCQTDPCSFVVSYDQA